MDNRMSFDKCFEGLTGSKPFPWQSNLYERLIRNEIRDGEIHALDIPTGLGKTSVIAIWLIALARHPDRVPRRLVYVVNRRTVVDQTTNEVERLRANLEKAGLSKPLEELCATATVGEDGEPPLAISTLRGQFADNREWSGDPARPAVIVGTVDMVGSRLLFSGYGLGFKSKPLHAGFLGQDVLLLHDEAHLEPAFQKLLTDIVTEQRASKAFKTFRVLELSATSKAKSSIELSSDDYKNELVLKRIKAKKEITLHEVADEKDVAETIATIAKRFVSTNEAVLIFVRKLADIDKIAKLLAKEETCQLTGTMRGYERDQMFDPKNAEASAVFVKFLPPQSSTVDESLRWKVKPVEKTGYLICTSAGEVGCNFSSTHLICDLTTYESMAQRFGRVNRFGEFDHSQIHIVHPAKLDEMNPYDERRLKTLGLMRRLERDASPRSLNTRLTRKERGDAFSPDPDMLLTSPCLFDAWALTSIRDKMPGRPLIEAYLHGIEDDVVKETQFAWRNEVDWFGSNIDQDDVDAIFECMPLRPHELLRIPTEGKGRAYDQLQKLSQRDPDLPVWVIEPDGSIDTRKKIGELVLKRGANYLVPLDSRVVLLPPKAGALTPHGTLDGGESYREDQKYDVAEAKDSTKFRVELRVGEDEKVHAEFLLDRDEASSDVDEESLKDIQIEKGELKDRDKILVAKMKDMGRSTRVDFSAKRNDDAADDLVVGPYEYLIFREVGSPSQKKLASAEWPSLVRHGKEVRDCAVKFCEKLGIEPWLAKAIVFAAAYHDLGKRRPAWQLGAGNKKANAYVAKTIHGRPPEKLNRYRHELGSVLDLMTTEEFVEEFKKLTDEQRNIVLHLIICHHGRGRPFFDLGELHDPDVADELVQKIAEEMPGRFARLQQKFGRWGLAYIESILRAADIFDSQRIESTTIGAAEKGGSSSVPQRIANFPFQQFLAPSISIDVNAANPGQFFACCGLFELANIKWPGAWAWFEDSRFQIHCDGDLSALLNSFVECELTNIMTDDEQARYRALEDMTKKQRSDANAEDEYDKLCKKRREEPILLKDPFNLTIDWFRDNLAGGSRFKTWAGQQSALEIASKMKAALKGDDWKNERCLSFAVHGCGLPFNFDSNLGAQGGARDIGFSFDALTGNASTRFEQPACPALELLAFIGLQRFRPLEYRDKFDLTKYRYVAWSRPLPINVAFAAACTALPVSRSKEFDFELLYRTKYLKSFLPAVPLTGDLDD